MYKTSSFRRSLYILSHISKKPQDEIRIPKIKNEELEKMLLALERLGLVKKDKDIYIISEKGQNILNYFNNDTYNLDSSPSIRNT